MTALFGAVLFGNINIFVDGNFGWDGFKIQ